LLIFIKFLVLLTKPFNILDFIVYVLFIVLDFVKLYWITALLRKERL